MNILGCCRRSARRGHDGHGGRLQPPGVDRASGGAQETQTLQQVPDPGAGEGVPLQRLRLQAEAMGAGAEPQLVRAAGENMVSEQENEKQKEQSETGGTTGE